MSESVTKSSIWKANIHLKGSYYIEPFAVSEEDKADFPEVKRDKTWLSGGASLERNVSGDKYFLGGTVSYNNASDAYWSFGTFGRMVLSEDTNFSIGVLFDKMKDGYTASMSAGGCYKWACASGTLGSNLTGFVLSVFLDIPIFTSKSESTSVTN